MPGRLSECMIPATKYDISMWCVLHENPTFDKMVGTLGSVLQRKVTEGFAIRKHKQANEPKDKKRSDRPPIYFTVEQLKARRFDQNDWDFEVLNNAEGWGVPQELDPQPETPQTEHTPEEIQKWVTEGQRSIEWPATRRDVYTNIFAPNGVTDEDEQKEGFTNLFLNSAVLYEQTKDEMTPSQKESKRLKINTEVILPF